MFSSVKQYLPLLSFVISLHINATEKNKVTVTGLVLDKATNEVIVKANIQDTQTLKGGYTNKQGFFSLPVSSGDVQLKVSHIGYQEKEMYLKIEKDTLIYFFLNKDEKQLREVVVEGNNASDNINSPQMGAIQMGQIMIRNIPALFGETDIIKALQTQPGVSAGIEGLAGMYVRGGNGDENLFMIDGHPLYQVNHLGGLFSAFNTEVVDNIVFYKSAFPARYGGRLSSVLDIRTKEGDLEEYHGSAMLGLTSGNLNVRGPVVKGKTAFNVALRRSWLDVLSVPALAFLNTENKKNGKKMIGRYAFTDLNLKIDHRFSDKSKAYIMLYYGNDFLKFGQEKFPSDSSSYYLTQDISNLSWGNTLVAGGWSYKLSNQLLMKTTASYTRYASVLNRSVFDSEGNKKDDDYTESRIEKSTENGINDSGFKLDFDYRPFDNHLIKFGSNYTYHFFHPESVKNQSYGDVEPAHTTDSDEQIFVHEWSAYIEDDWELSSVFHINGGLRFGSFNVGQKTYKNWEPRISGRWLLSPALSFKASYSRMNQYVQQISDSYLSLPTDFWMPINKNFKPLVSDQISAGFYRNIDDIYTFSMEGYYKWMNNLLEYKDGYSILWSSATWDKKLTSGKGQSYGVDMLAKKETGQLTGWIGYGLLWADRQFEEINLGERYPSKYDNRHKLNVVANYKLKENVELNGSWMYMTGNRVTLSLENYQDLPIAGFPSNLVPANPYQDPWGLSYYDKKNNVRLPAYHRLDFGINIYRPKTKGRMGIWNVSIYNAYSRINPIVIQKNSFYSHSAGGHKLNPRFQSLGLLPIIPSVSYTYKF
jgi:uncharacterized protein YifE (UPF0438 family)